VSPTDEGKYQMLEPTSDPVSDSRWFDRTWRWWVLAMLFSAMVLGALDRQALSLTMSPIAEEFNLNDVQRGELLAAFMFSYAICHLFIGLGLDHVRNIRRFFPLMVVGWSLCGMAVWFANDYQTIKWLRYLLGFAEAGVFPLSLMLIARIFPSKERAFASGVFNSGTLLATLLAPWIVVAISNSLGWRASFVITGAIGFFWFIPWLLIFRDPERRAANWPKVEESNSQMHSPDRFKIGEILRSPAFWALSLMGIGIVPGWFFLLNWLPTFMEKEWNLEYGSELVYSLTAVRAAQDTGLWLGGLTAWWLASKGMTVLKARKSVVIAGYVLMLPVAFLPWVTSINLGIAIFAMYAFGVAAWLANMQAFKQDVLPNRVATVVAWIGFIETGFAAYVVQDIGRLVQDRGGYDGIFLMLAVFHTVAIVVGIIALKPKWFQTK
jgi:MFS transporter, ACS family, aldohexuronate transporter